LAEARRRKLRLPWDGYAPPKPNALGVTTLERYDLAKLVDYIDWTPFFKTWELKGSYPAILDDPTAGAEWRRACSRRTPYWDSSRPTRWTTTTSRYTGTKTVPL
jgi:cobalamin-dependent methionine synthase I